MKTPLEQLEFWIEQFYRINGTPTLEDIKGQINLLKDYEIEQLQIPRFVDAKRELAIKFADALLNDFEMSEFENETLCWKLCGLPYKYTTTEVYDRYIGEILNNDLM